VIKCVISQVMRMNWPLDIRRFGKIRGHLADIFDRDLSLGDRTGSPRRLTDELEEA
jgi:hypothetical protein